MIACETAINSFLTILDVVGGPNEKIRANQFLKQIRTYPDLSEEEENSVWENCRLKVGGKIRERMFKIITFGMFHRALTVTANKGALEAAKMQVEKKNENHSKSFRMIDLSYFRASIFHQ